MSNQVWPEGLIIGAGNIGLKFYDELTEHHTLSMTRIWNHRDKAEIARLKGYNYEMNQRNLILAGDDQETSQFKPYIGWENLEASMKGAKIIVITAGERREGSEQRSILLPKNMPMFRRFADAAANAADPDAIYVIISNPVDSMATAFQELSGIPTNQIIAAGGMLDTARYKERICTAANVSNIQIRNARVYGRHDDEMVMTINETEVFVNGEWQPLTKVVTDEQRIEIITKTKEAGKIIGQLTGQTAYVAPAAMLEVIVGEIKKSLQPGYVPNKSFIASAYSEEYDLYMGQEVQLQPGGKVKVVKPSFDLSPKEQDLLELSARAIRKNLNLVPGKGFSLAA